MSLFVYVGCGILKKLRFFLAFHSYLNLFELKPSTAKFISWATLILITDIQNKYNFRDILMSNKLQNLTLPYFRDRKSFQVPQSKSCVLSVFGFINCNVVGSFSVTSIEIRNTKSMPLTFFKTFQPL